MHVYNVEDVVLCALPYHDTHAFVRIVQLITTGLVSDDSFHSFIRFFLKC